MDIYGGLTTDDPGKSNISPQLTELSMKAGGKRKMINQTKDGPICYPQYNAPAFIGLEGMPCFIGHEGVFNNLYGPLFDCANNKREFDIYKKCAVMGVVPNLLTEPISGETVSICNKGTLSVMHYTNVKIQQGEKIRLWTPVWSCVKDYMDLYMDKYRPGRQGGLENVILPLLLPESEAISKSGAMLDQMVKKMAARPTSVPVANCLKLRSLPDDFFKNDRYACEISYDWLKDNVQTSENPLLTLVVIYRQLCAKMYSHFLTNPVDFVAAAVAGGVGYECGLDPANGLPNDISTAQFERLIADTNVLGALIQYTNQRNEVISSMKGWELGTAMEDSIVGQMLEIGI